MANGFGFQTVKVQGCDFTDTDFDGSQRVAVVNAVARVDPRLPVYDFRTMEIQIAESMYIERLVGRCRRCSVCWRARGRAEFRALAGARAHPIRNEPGCPGWAPEFASI